MNKRKNLELISFRREKKECKAAFKPVTAERFTLIELLVSTVISSWHFFAQKSAVATQQRIPLFLKKGVGFGERGKTSFPVKRSFSPLPKSAFTLIELLVVIAMMAILAAILLPALTSARERGKSSSCAMNMRQVMMAHHAYCDENDDYFVPFEYEITGQRHPAPWTAIMAVLGGQISSGGIFDCPSIPERGPLDWLIANCGGEATDARLTKSQWQRCGAGYNSWYLGGGKTGLETLTKRIKVLNPSATIALCDAAFYQNYGDGNDQQGYYLANRTKASSKAGQVRARHSGDKAVNVAWVDGHVSSATANAASPYDQAPFSNGYARDEGTSANFWDLQ